MTRKRNNASNALRRARAVRSGVPDANSVRDRRTEYDPVAGGQLRAFTAVATAVRAWVEPRKPRRSRKRKAAKVPWRPQRYGERVLVFDTETTTDAAQRLLFGFFRLYERDRLILEGLIVSDALDYGQMTTLAAYAARCRLPIYRRERFVEEIFYPEVYVLGTLCVGFNLPFDLTRIAIHAGSGRGENRRKFRVMLSRRVRWHDLRIESASGEPPSSASFPSASSTNGSGRSLRVGSLISARLAAHLAASGIRCAAQAKRFGPLRAR